MSYIPTKDSAHLMVPRGPLQLQNDFHVIPLNLLSNPQSLALIVDSDQISLGMSLRLAAVLAGFVSWIFLNRRTVRGDYAVIFFLATFPALYFCFRRVIANHAFFQTVKIAAIYFVSLTSSTLLYRLSPFHPLAAYPGPLVWRLSSMTLAAISYRGHRHLVLEDLHRKYGKFVRIGPNALSINSPNAASVIYGAAHHMLKSESYNKPGHIGGVSLFFKQDRNDHAKRKRIWANAFTGSAVDNFFPPLERRTWQLTQCIENRTDGAGVVNLAECICHWSYDFMGEMVFGGSNNLILLGTHEGWRPTGLHRRNIFWSHSIGQAPWLMDILWYIPGSESIHRLRHVAASMMRKRVQAKGVKIRDLSSYLIEGDPRSGEQISMSDLEVDAVIAIQGGSDNTGITLALAIYFILSHLPAYHTLQADLDNVFPDATAPLDKRKLAAVPFLDAVINETLRLGSPFFLPRIIPKGGVVIDGKFIPGGSVVALSAYSQQVSQENFFPDPLAYRPERWMPGGLGTGSILNKAALVSFSSGPYVCIGKSFAIQEMRLCLARLVLTFDMTLPPSFDSKLFYKGLRNMRTTILDKPLLVKAVRREGKMPVDL
ncbi:hypothetical protein EW146_g10002 [Bondarzewia mesenterica]|uniref:Cytochrome P450 n=1 Tax=Bondarzewia mesenterica TaxID=1095465 RepID=A0A4S4L1A9_9AGAM|nr:hypothetical protein EW146_g10002 [Bondarzewia mesenterica]